MADLGELLPGWFIDGRGRRWLCVERRPPNDTIVCNSDDGWMTAANHATFARWGWKPEAALAQQKQGERK